MSDEQSRQERTGTFKENDITQAQQADSQYINSPLRTHRLSDSQLLLKDDKPVRPARRRPLRALMLLLIGILLGVMAALIFLLSFGGSDVPATTTSASKQAANVNMHVDPAVVLPLIENSWQTAGVPGSISNLRLLPARGDQATLTGNYTVSLLGVSLTRPFTVVAQPTAEQCHVHINILHADFSGVSITKLVATLENTINQQLQLVSRTLSGNMTYCINSVQTDTTGFIVAVEVTSRT